MSEKEYWYWLLNLEGIGRVKIERLLQYFEHPRNIYEAAYQQLVQIQGIDGKAALSIINGRDADKIKESYAKLSARDIYFVARTDWDYPEKLSRIPQAPFGLYVKGRLPDPTLPAIAIVGARNCSNYGKEAAILFAGRLSDAGIQVISGLARGVDGYAHSGAMRGASPTFGVLGCGIDICYPRENLELYRNMQRNGGIISEYAPGINGIPAYFPMRNRIISGLADGILVIEAKKKSGSLITADLGLDQGKPVFAVPGRFDDVLSRGCNNLIQAGAELVNDPSDILEHYQINRSEKMCSSKKNNYVLETNEKIVYASLSLMPKHPQQIADETDLPVTGVIRELVALELKGYVGQTAKNYYVVIQDNVRE